MTAATRIAQQYCKAGRHRGSDTAAFLRSCSHHGWIGIRAEQNHAGLSAAGAKVRRRDRHRKTAFICTRAIPVPPKPPAAGGGTCVDADRVGELARDPVAATTDRGVALRRHQTGLFCPAGCWKTLRFPCGFLMNSLRSAMPGRMGPIPKGAISAAEHQTSRSVVATPGNVRPSGRPRSRGLGRAAPGRSRML